MNAVDIDTNLTYWCNVYWNYLHLTESDRVRSAEWMLKTSVTMTNAVSQCHPLWLSTLGSPQSSVLNALLVTQVLILLTIPVYHWQRPAQHAMIQRSSVMAQGLLRLSGQALGLLNPLHVINGAALETCGMMINYWSQSTQTKAGPAYENGAVNDTLRKPSRPHGLY